MIRHTPLILFCALALSAGAQVPFAWDAEASRALAATKDVYRGETVALRPDWLGYGTAVDTNGWAFTLCWQTNGMGDAWWTDSTNAFLWTPERDCGASRYTLFIRAAAPGGVSYRANAVLRMLPSPGFDPAVLPPPSVYPTLAAELAPLVVPLIKVQESDLAALGVIATQRVERVWSPDAMEYRDGTGGVWRVRSVQQGYWTLSVLGSEYGTATNAYYEILTAPINFYDYNYGFGSGDGQAYFSWHVNDEQPGQGQIYVEVQGEEGVHDGFIETNQVASGSIDFATSVYHTMIRLAWSNEPPLIVTQHVDTAELKSTLAGPRLALIEAETNLWRAAHALASAAPTRAQIPAIVMSNSVSQLVIWTNSVGAATNIAWRENGVWHTNALGGAADAELPEGIITNGQSSVSLGSVLFRDYSSTPNEHLVSFYDLSGAEVAFIRDDGIFYPKAFSTYDNVTAAIVDGSANPGANVNGLNIGSAGKIGFTSAQWWQSPDLVVYRAAAGKMGISKSGVATPDGELAAGLVVAAELRSLGGITLPNIGTNTTAYLFVSNNLMWVRGVTP